MKFAQSFKTVCSSYISSLDQQKFDKDFHTIMKFFFFFGFYRPIRLNKLFASCAFIIMIVTYTLGSLKDVVKLSQIKDLPKTIISIFTFVFGLSLTVLNLTVMAKHGKITRMIKALQMLHEKDDESFIDNCRRNCFLMLRIYKACLTVTVCFAVLFKFAGYHSYFLVIPVLYDEFAHGDLYYFLLIVSFLQTVGLLFLFVSSDLIHVFCMLRLEANLKLLNWKLRRCTDSDDLRENEESLVACVRYHSAIIEWEIIKHLLLLLLY